MTQRTKDTMTSRFVVAGDDKEETFVFPLPKTWWSRPYEYAWSAQFVGAQDVCLDAACGIGHPFKFFLAEHCRETHGCDLDERITRPDVIRRDLREYLGVEPSTCFRGDPFERMRLVRGSVLDLPYPDRMFDKVFCISVLEHLNPWVERRHWLGRLKPFEGLFAKEWRRSLREFTRVLAPGGRIILTFDFPVINLRYFATHIQDLGLRFAGPVDLEQPPDAIRTPKGDLRCFRAILERAGE